MYRSEAPRSKSVREFEQLVLETLR